MNPSCLVSVLQGGGGVMTWVLLSWHISGPLVPAEHCSDAAAYLSVVKNQ